MQPELQEMQDEIKAVIQLMVKFGKALEIDMSLVGDGLNPQNLLAYMGMIEQTITEMMLASGMQSTPARSVHQESAGSKTPGQLDFHLPDANAQMDDSDEDSDGDEAVMFAGAEAFKKKMEMKFGQN